MINRYRDCLAGAERHGGKPVSAEWVIDKHGVHKSGGYRITRESPGVFHLHYRGKLIETSQSINALNRIVNKRTKGKIRTVTGGLPA
jgi:hypothetical protein